MKFAELAADAFIRLFDDRGTCFVSFNNPFGTKCAAYATGLAPIAKYNLLIMLFFFGLFSFFGGSTRKLRGIYGLFRCPAPVFGVIHCIRASIKLFGRSLVTGFFLQVFKNIIIKREYFYKLIKFHVWIVTSTLL